MVENGHGHFDQEKVILTVSQEGIDEINWSLCAFTNSGKLQVTSVTVGW